MLGFIGRPVPLHFCPGAYLTFSTTMTFCTDTSAFKSASITEWMDIGEGADSMTPERGEAPSSEVTRGGALTEDGRKHRMLDVLLGV